jgi:Uma2 family endonuclease
VIARLVHALVGWADAHGAAAFAAPDVYYTERDHVTPDAVLVGADTLDVIRDRHIAGPPDLIVEVSSPSTRRYDVITKRALYEAQGFAEYWFVDLEAERVEVYRIADGHYPAPELVGRSAAIEPPHLPGLRVEVDDILRPLPGAAGGG